MSRLQRIGWWGQRLTEVVVAIFVAYIAITMIEYREAVQKDSVEPSDWFVVNEIYVPDHEVGSNPLMIYDREIRVPHLGFWVVEAQRINPDGREGVFQNACSGSGVSDYDLDEVLGRGNEVTWEWFFGRPCVIPPGTYRLLLTKDMTVPGYPVKQDRYVSNTFHVTR